MSCFGICTQPYFKAPHKGGSATSLKWSASNTNAHVAYTSITRRLHAYPTTQARTSRHPTPFVASREAPAKCQRNRYHQLIRDRTGHRGHPGPMARLPRNLWERGTTHPPLKFAPQDMQQGKNLKAMLSQSWPSLLERPQNNTHWFITELPEQSSSVIKVARKGMHSKWSPPLLRHQCFRNRAFEYRCSHNTK